MKSTLEVLKEARWVISEPGSWCKDSLYKEATGQHCALGAVIRATGQDSMPIYREDRSLSPAYNSARSSLARTVMVDPARFNNATNQECVLAMFDATIELLEMTA